MFSDTMTIVWYIFIWKEKLWLRLIDLQNWNENEELDGYDTVLCFRAQEKNDGDFAYSF